MAVLRFIIGLALTIAIAAFSVLNRTDLTVTWSPFHESLTLPLYIFILGAMAIGFLFGGSMVWLNMGSLRKERRRQKKDIKILEQEMTHLKEDLAKNHKPVSTDLPILSAKSR